MPKKELMLLRSFVCDEVNVAGNNAVAVEDVVEPESQSTIIWTYVL